MKKLTNTTGIAAKFLLVQFRIPEVRNMNFSPTPDYPS